MKMLLLTLLVGLPIILCACNRSPAVVAPSIQTMPERHIIANVVDPPPAEPIPRNAPELFATAIAAQRAEKCPEAENLYGRLVNTFPTSDLVLPSLYNRGLCLETLQQPENAAAAFERLIETFPEAEDVRDALFRLAGLYEQTEQFEKVVETTEQILFRYPDLRDIEKVEALARKGAALVAQSSLNEGKRTLEEAIRTYRYGKDIRPTDSVTYYSMAQFHLGELLHRQMRETELPANEAILRERLEKKATLLLSAQRRYTDAIKARDPKWASAAAYRTGALYHHLWVDMLDAPPPEDLNEEEREIYREILETRIRNLLKKAVRQWERTLKMATRLQLDNRWVESAREDLLKIKAIVREQSD